jgi:hypothetical protein
VNFIIGGLFLLVGIICFLFPRQIIKYDLTNYETYFKIAITRFGGLLALIIGLVFCFSPELVSDFFHIS